MVLAEPLQEESVEWPVGATGRRKKRKGHTSSSGVGNEKVVTSV